VARTVATVASSTPLLEKATRTIRTTVSDTVAKTDQLVGETATGPVVGAAHEVVTDTAENAESSTRQGDSHQLRHQESEAANILAGLLASTSGAGSTAATGTADVASADTGDGPADRPAGTPSLPDPCTSPSGSGSSSSFTPAGVIESSLLVTSSVLRDPVSWRLARLPGGPAYQPGSSPD
jgi:hypothetical protein